MTTLSRPHLFGMIAGFFLAAGLVGSAALGTVAWLKIRNSQFITVKGSARKNILSDLVIWRGAFATQSPTLIEAQKKLKSDAGVVENFLRGHAVTNFSFAPIEITEVKATLESAGLTSEKIVGYRLSQDVRVESSDVERVRALDRDCTELVEGGLLFTTQRPQFIYTKAGEAKVEMLAEATRDARVRAEQIAAQGGRTIARLHDADMGVIQITPLYGGQTSWEGMNDTSSQDKTVTAVVTATFALK